MSSWGMSSRRRRTDRRIAVSEPPYLDWIDIYTVSGGELPRGEAPRATATADASWAGRVRAQG